MGEISNYETLFSLKAIMKKINDEIIALSRSALVLDW